MERHIRVVIIIEAAFLMLLIIALVAAVLMFSQVPVCIKDAMACFFITVMAVMLTAKKSGCNSSDLDNE